jgi:asparagine synthase (glutamine-hydrolysing)
MSGIFGIVRCGEARVAEAELAQMADELKHRGPDGIRYSARDNVGLGHCMLQSTPESLHEILPFRDDASGLVITADARIDNREQLIEDIPVRPASGAIISDSHLILCSYRKWGEACVDHLLGDFAFVIWDERAHSLFVARDHMGCKPFYYHCHDGLFVFASSASGVARIPEVKATLNEGRLADYLVRELEGINKTCTWYNEISRLPPAHCGDFRDNCFHARQYWALEPAEIGHLQSDEDYLQAFTEVYEEAVRVRLRCQAEPASMLSGGLDSSTIVALARDLLVAEGMPPLRTYSGISEEAGDCPETQSVDAVVEWGNLRSTVLTPSAIDTYADTLNNALKISEDPFDSGCTLLSLMFLVAAQDGGRMVFTGLDGEHAVGGPTNYLNYLLREGLLRRAWQEARKFSEHYYRGGYSALVLYLRAIRSCLTPNIVRKIRRWLGFPSRYRRLCSERHISSHFAHRANLRARVKEYDQNLSVPSADLKTWHQHIVQVPYLTAGVERYERLASCFRIEPRHPLLDIRLLELAAAFPLQYKTRDGWSKFSLRQVARSRLPYSVAWREGWEELGWLFLSRWSQNLAVVPFLSQASLENTLSKYMDDDYFLTRAEGDVDQDDRDKSAQLWRYYGVANWLQRYEMRK